MSLFATSAFGEAIETVAYWNSDFANGSAKDGYTVTLGEGATVNADGTVTLAEQTGKTTLPTHGVEISFYDESGETAFDGAEMTVLVKYSGLSITVSRYPLLATVWGDGTNSAEFVLSVKNQNQMFYEDGITATSSPTDTAMGSVKQTLPTEGYMLVCMSGSDSGCKGTRIGFAPLNEDGSCGDFVDYGYQSAATHTDKSFFGIKIGGTIGPINHFYRPGMKVEGVAIIKGFTTTMRTFRYLFPNEAYRVDYADTNPTAETKFVDVDGLIVKTIADGIFAAKVTTGSMAWVGGMVCACQKSFTPSEDEPTTVSMQYQVHNNDWDKSADIYFTDKTDGVYFKKTGGHYHAASEDKLGTDDATWQYSNGAYNFNDFSIYIPHVIDVGGSVNWSSVTWPWGGVPTEDDVVWLNVTKDATITIDASDAVDMLHVTSSSAKLTFRYTSASVLLSSRVWDFTKAAGKVVFDCRSLSVSGSVTLMSGVIRGTENIDVEGSSVPEGVSLVVTDNAIKLSAAQWTNGEGDNDITKPANWRNNYVPFADGVFTDDFSLGANADWSGVTFAAQTESRVVNLNGYKVTFASLSDSFGKMEFKDGSEEKTGELALATGTTKLWSGFSTDEGLRVRVAGGATLDLNGISGTLFKLVLSDGSTLTNTGADIGSDVVSVGGGIELDEGATNYVVATKKISLAAPDFAKWTLDLNGGRLVKSGSAALEFENAYLQGPGTLDMQVKQITFGSNGFGMSDGAVIYLAKDQYTYPDADVMVSNLAGEGIVGNKNYIYTVTKSFGGLLTSDAKGVVLADGVTLDLRENDGTYSWLSNMSIADGAKVTVNLAGRDVSAGDKIISWNTKQNVKFWLDEATQKRGVFAVVRDDGLYLEKAEGLVIGVR